MARVHIKPELFRWAIERSRISELSLVKRFPKLPEWETGELQPTLKQVEDFAIRTHTPIGYFFLPEPPNEPLPIHDFRTISGNAASPSANLLDTIYSMQRRQAWLSEDRRDAGHHPLDFVGSALLRDEPEAIGREMRRALNLAAGWASEAASWTDAVSLLRESIEELGVIVVVNGVVENNTTRRLNVQEFRGFALADVHAPLIFVNGADSKSAQMFTLAHELAHLWLGVVGQGLSGFEGIFPGGNDVERFCDVAAAEFLVPGSELKALWSKAGNEDEPFTYLSRVFKVSPIVAGRRAMDMQLVDREQFFMFYREYTNRERKSEKKPTGGDFYNNQNTRVGKRFARTVMNAALEGRLSFKEAYSLTGLTGGSFQEYGRRVGVPLP
jgi:Zn-dependent peptidase ImmA (M78 family)